MTPPPEATERGIIACRHCGAVMERPAPSVVYCCHGCEAAAGIIAAAGLDAWYERRESTAPRPDARDGARGAWSSAGVTRAEDGVCSADVRIDGLTCASCAWVTERVLLATPGVTDARVAIASGRASLSWDPNVVDLPTLAGRVASIGYRPRPAGALPRYDVDLMARAGVAVFCAMNVMGLTAALYAGWFEGIDAREAALFRWVSLALATPAVLWSAQPIVRGAVAGLKVRALHIDLPVTVGIVAMYAHGVWSTFHAEEGWLDSLTMLIALLLVARVLEQRGRRAASEAASALAGTAPASARRVTETGVDDVGAEQLRVGDLVDVGLGEEVPADGHVVAASGEGGAGRVRMAMLTGESEPVARAAGDEVVAGALVEHGTLRVRVDAVGGDTLVQRMSRALADAIDRPAPRELADRVAPAFTGVTLVAALLTLGAWWFIAEPATAGRYAMAVLVVACPCALALAGPLSTAAGLAATARHGMLVRDGAALRTLPLVDILAFDKTGTLTGGRPEVVSAEDGDLRVAAGLERASAHPLARALRAEAARRGIALAWAEDLVETAGVGVRGRVDGVEWSLGAGEPGTLSLQSAAGHRGTILLRDRPRPDAAAVLERLAHAGGRARRLVVLSGDRQEVVDRVGASVGVAECLGGLRPEDKVAWITARQAEGSKVLFVGDGVNDGPALAVADVAVVMGEGAASSLSIADAVVVGDGLRPLATAFAVATRVGSTIRTGTTRSLVYNVTAVLAASFGWVNPLVAALLMPLSSAMVAWTSFRAGRVEDT